MKNNIASVLKLENLVFDKLCFKRIDASSDEEFKFKIGYNISQCDEKDIYKVTLMFNGYKPSEYTLDIDVSGLFSFRTTESLSEEDKNILITQNTLSILMPYLRSEISLLTAQPGVECVVLPPFNINRLIEEQNRQ